MEFGLDILRSLDAAPTAWYKGGHFTENTGYKLALISQPVFFGKRTKLQICPPKVDPEASLSNTNLTSPLPIDTLITPLPHINGSYYIWTRHVKFEWVVSYMNEPCRIWTSHVSHMTESRHIWTSHVTYKQGHILRQSIGAVFDESCHIWMSKLNLNLKSNLNESCHVEKLNLKSNLNESCHISTRHVSLHSLGTVQCSMSLALPWAFRQCWRCVSVSITVSASVSMSVSAYMSVSMSVFLSAFLSVSLSVSVSSSECACLCVCAWGVRVCLCVYVCVCLCKGLLEYNIWNEPCQT